MLISTIATSRRPPLVMQVTVRVLLVSWLLAAGSVFASGKALSVDRINTMPLAFTQNNGQWDSQALFRANAGGFTAWFAKDKIYYQFARRIGGEDTPLNPLSRGDLGSSLCDADYNLKLPLLRGASGVSDNDSVITMSISATFVGANPNPEVVGEGLMEYKCNYFIGNEPEKWQTNVPNYKAVVYKEIYPGIDLKYYGNGDGKMEYDFIVQPGFDPRQIAIRFDGANEVCVDDRGQLVVETEWGEVTEHAPVVWQVIGGDVVEIQAEYVLKEGRTFGFKLDEGYEPEYASVIDPVLSYSTYIGGTDQDFGDAIAIDGDGDIYVGGDTYSIDFPTENPYQGTNPARSDVLVVKLNRSGDSLIYSTYVGGNDDDFAEGMAIDQSGRVYITGQTRSTDFPTLSAFQPTIRGYANVFVTRLGSGGNSLSYSTYLGGNYVDYGQAIAVNSIGEAFVTGWTRSSNFPMKNAIHATYQGDDGFITKLNSSGSALLYSTLLGGPNSTEGHGIAIDKSDCAYLVGATSSQTFPVQNPIQATYQGGLEDAFLMKLNSAGSGLEFSTYLGGSGWEYGYGVAVDDTGNVYIAGGTSSANFPNKSPAQATFGGSNWDAFVTKIDIAGDSIVYSTYLGGDQMDIARGIAIDGQGSVYVCGITVSSDFPIQNAYQDTIKGSFCSEAFVSKLTEEGSALVFSTYLGGSRNDDGKAIAVDGFGQVFVVGETASSDFPMRNAYQTTSQGHFEVFITKLRESMCGDADGSHDINIADAVYLIAYIFSGGPAPDPLVSGDTDCSGDINIADVVYLIAYIFSGGPEPCAAC